MDDPKISVTLTGPAKIAGKRLPPGKTVTVSHTLALQLAASGVINPEVARTLAEAISDVSDEITSGQEDRPAEMKAEVEARLREEIGDELAAALAEKAALVRLVRDLEDAEARAKAEIANLIASLAAETTARVELEKQFAEAEARASNAEVALAELSANGGDGGATDQPEGGETPPADGAANTKKAGKKPVAGKT